MKVISNGDGYEAVLMEPGDPQQMSMDDITDAIEKHRERHDGVYLHWYREKARLEAEAIAIEAAGNKDGG